ncbi:MAG: hypothetical protein ACJ74F_31245 [Mycobacterium sp.]|jgi:acyl-coenzyme A thioesterase PaaI-like protein|uniref:hypothetical protein n=1 Tax=Mycobacterium sp. TaxID=1785 RepID=UPI00389A742A
MGVYGQSGERRAVNDGRHDQPSNTTSLRLNFLREFRSGLESRYVGTALRVGRGSGVAEAQAVGDDGKAAIIARITAYLG